MSWFIEMEVDKTQEEESPKKLSDLDVSVYILWIQESGWYSGPQSYKFFFCVLVKKNNQSV